MPAFQNLDLFSVGIAVAASLLIGFAAFWGRRKSATRRLLLFFILANVGWGIVNYLSYAFTDPSTRLWLIRFVLFFASLQSFFFFLMMRSFPDDMLKIKKRALNFLSFLTIAVALLTLTPAVFSGIEAGAGGVSQPIPEPGIIVFGIAAIAFVVFGIITLLKKLARAVTPETKAQFKAIFLGVVIMFAFIIVFNFGFPIFLRETRLIPLSALFTFPFIVMTVYAIFRHHLLHVRVVATEVLTFVLSVVTLSEVVIERNPVLVVLRSGVFVLVLAVGILLIKSVLKEIEQREKLAEQAKELENLSRFKTQLLSLASHQIKAPLAAIKGFAELIEQGLYGPVSDKVKETVGKMRHSTDELIDLINDLLDFRRVEEGKIEYHFEKLDMRDVVKRVADKLKLLADEKHLALAVELPSEPVFVNADKEKLSQVIQNLLDNSIKYTSAGRVRVTVRTEQIANSKEQEVVFEVSDSGLGIPKDLLPHLFDEFIRDERVKKEVRGTGLGLYIARKITEAHNGTIEASSDGEGKGSTFTVTLKKL